LLEAFRGAPSATGSSAPPTSTAWWTMLNPLADATLELKRPWTCMRSWPNTKHLGFTCAASKRVTDAAWRRWTCLLHSLYVTALSVEQLKFL
jgi:hypothetical protein